MDEEGTFILVYTDRGRVRIPLQESWYSMHTTAARLYPLHRLYSLHRLYPLHRLYSTPLTLLNSTDSTGSIPLQDTYFAEPLTALLGGQLEGNLRLD